MPKPTTDADRKHPTLRDAVSPTVLTGLNQPLWLQNSVYNAALDRQLIGATLRPGVMGYGELGVVQRASGANMSVDVAAGRVVVPVNDAPNLGSALCTSTAVNNLPIAGAPAAGTSRIDLVIARVYDASLIGGSINGWQLEVVTGTAASTPAAPALPKSSIELARVAVAAGQASVVTANITDRRNIYIPNAPTMEGFFNGIFGGAITGGDVDVVPAFNMPFLGNIIMQAEVLYLPGTSASPTVSVFSASGTPAPTTKPLAYGPLQPANSTRAQLTAFGYWQAVPAGTPVSLKCFVQSSAGAGAQLVLDHIAGSYRLIPT
jgi:hypothetical protein